MAALISRSYSPSLEPWSRLGCRIVSQSTANEEPAAPPPNPLERFTSGGWAKGLVRLALGLGIVATVIWLAGGDSLKLLLDREVALFLGLGATVHLGQRVARILKWARMIEPAGLVKRRWTYLLRIQLVGMIANLVLPVSEALKVWAVSENRRQVLWASESVVVETALHASLIGLAGGIGLLTAGQPSPPLLWVAAGSMCGAPLALLAALRWWPRQHPPNLRVAELGVLGWTAAETLCQLALYALAVRAIGVEIQISQLLMLSPVLFLADLVMVTPSGLGLREALFAVVLQTLSGAPAGAAVAVGLLITTMLLLTATVGGGVALALPRAATEAPS